MANFVVLHGQNNATRVWKKSDAGLKSSLRRPTLDSLFWKTKRESRINLLRSVRKGEGEN
jgi:hypothetical protein